MGITDFVRVINEEEMTAIKLSHKLCEVDDINAPILINDEKLVGRIEGTEYDAAANILYINICFFKGTPDLQSVKTTVKELGEVLGNHHKALVKFRSEGKLYHLYQYGNAVLKNKSNGEALKFTLVRVYKGRFKFDTNRLFNGIKSKLWK